MPNDSAFRKGIDHWYTKNDGENAKWAREIYNNLKRKPFTFDEEEEEDEQPLDKQ